MSSYKQYYWLTVLMRKCYEGHRGCDVRLQRHDPAIKCQWLVMVDTSQRLTPRYLSNPSTTHQMQLHQHQHSGPPKMGTLIHLEDYCHYRQYQSRYQNYNLKHEKLILWHNQDYKDMHDNLFAKIHVNLTPLVV